MNHKERRNFSGSARSRLTKIDRLSKMMLTTQTSSPNLNIGSTAGLPRATSPRRTRPSLQPPSNTTTSAASAAVAAAAAVATSASPVKIPGSSSSRSGKVGSPTSPAFKGSRQSFGASHAGSSNSKYPRHIVMRAASPHCMLDDSLDSDAPTDSFSTSLPLASGFAAGVDPAINGDPAPAADPVTSEKANRHASMPLPKPGWRLYDVEESRNLQQGQDEGSASASGFDSGNGAGDGGSIFHYSASNASSTTHLDHYPYSHAAHARQDSTSTFYTMTPNASHLDLSMPISNHNLSSMDPSTDSNSSVTGHTQGQQGPTPSPSIYNMPPPLPKAIKNTKSPLALRRSSTTSSSSSSSPSNTYLNKGSFPKSSLSSTMIHNSKTLTQERQKIILEILRTERSYVDGLIILQTLFYEPLSAPYATTGYPYSGVNTTTSIYSAANTTLHHNNNSNKHPNPNTNNNGWSGAINPAASSSTLSLNNSASLYPTSTVGSNSTLAASAAPLLPKKSVSEIFSNFSEILQVNTLLLTQLETRICGTTFSTGWESDEDETDAGHGGADGGNDGESNGAAVGSQESNANRTPNQVLVTVGSQAGEQEQILVLDADWCVGDIFIEIAPFLKMYSNYVKTYTSALTHINDCMNRNDRFTEFLKSTARRPECKNLDFQSYLMLPVQRIPRYRMLLESLLRHTPEDHPDHRKLQTAFESMEQTANFVNETIRQHEMFGEMVELQSKITGMNEPLIIPGRMMLKRGNVWKVCRRNVQLRMIILFSDCIVWTSPSLNPLDDTLTFHRKVGLENCTVVGAEDPDPTKNAFQIMSPEKSSQVYVDSPREKEAWMVAIRRATQEYLSAKRTLKISITPMQSISAAATSFGAGLLRRDTGLWSPTTFGSDSRAQTFLGHQQQQQQQASYDPEPASPSPWSTTFGGGFSSAISGSSGGATAGSPLQKTQPLRVIENYSAPIWVPDHSATRCMICTEEFGTIFRRKHHCRACGKVVCHSCSSRTILIKGTHSEKLGRACDDCIDTMFPEEASAPASPTIASNSAEISPTEAPDQHSQKVNPSNQDAKDRRASSQSLDGIFIRPEDYNQEPVMASGATGMVRGFVEAGLSRMKSRTGPINANQDSSSGQNGGSPNSTRASNRKSDTPSLVSPNENQNNVKACELCKTEFNLFKFKWRNVCSQCRRVVCSDCLTKKQIDQLFLLGLEAEREAKAREEEGGQVVDSLALNPPPPLGSTTSPDMEVRPGLLQSASDTVVTSGSQDTTAAAILNTKRSQSFNNDQPTSFAGGSYGGFGTGWRGIKGNTDSGHGQAEKLCDPCYMGLSADQVKVLESGGGWQYYQATLSKHQTQDVIAALAAHMSLEGDDGEGEVEGEDEDEDDVSPIDAMRFGPEIGGVEVVNPVLAG
ncbi:hypothetical protein EC991_000012 [Linnemannia zychae]|nr:hypothetical protein EC991_000012 [Linnemannia zychae]